MDDVLNCPICKNKLRTIKKRYYSNGPSSPIINCLERTCAKGINHSLQILTDKNSLKVNFLKMSLNSKFSKFIEIDFQKEKCRIICLKNNMPTYLEVDKLLETDFPDLNKLKEKVDVYISLS